MQTEWISAGKIHRKKSNKQITKNKVAKKKGCGYTFALEIFSGNCIHMLVQKVILPIMSETERRMHEENLRCERTTIHLRMLSRFVKLRYKVKTKLITGNGQ